MPGIAQETKDDLRHQIEFRHDNDFILLTDRYYSSGLFLNYRHRLQNSVFRNGEEQLFFGIKQEAHTPFNTETNMISEMDRPYVGYLGLTSGWSRFTAQSGIDLSLQLGIAGEASGGGGFQRWYHNAIVISDPPVWVDEMESSFHVNLYGSYLYEWKLAPNPFSIYAMLKSEAALGSKDTYLKPQAAIYFGRRNETKKSLAYHRVADADKEIYFALLLDYTFVFHNALFEGNAFGDNSIFLVDPNTSVFSFGVDFRHRIGQNNYWVGYRYNASEANTTKPHRFIVLSYARSF